jgi:hypothetical protein
VTPQRAIAANLTRAAVTLAFAAVLLVAVSGVCVWLALSASHQVTQISNGNTPSTEKARQNQAELRFLLCSRSSSLVAPERRAGVLAVCRGYTSLSEAYRSQGVPPRLH